MKTALLVLLAFAALAYAQDANKSPLEAEVPYDGQISLEALEDDELIQANILDLVKVDVTNPVQSLRKKRGLIGILFGKPKPVTKRPDTEQEWGEATGYPETIQESKEDNTGKLINVGVGNLISLGIGK